MNKDGIIDGTDNQLIDKDAYRFASGYLNTDTYGNNFVDGSDAAIANNNAFNYVVLLDHDSIGNRQ